MVTQLPALSVISHYLDYSRWYHYHTDSIIGFVFKLSIWISFGQTLIWSEILSDNTLQTKYEVGFRDILRCILAVMLWRLQLQVKLTHFAALTQSDSQISRDLLCNVFTVRQLSMYSTSTWMEWRKDMLFAGWLAAVSQIVT